MSLVDELIAEVTDDPESIGLILHGSRAAGVHGPDSDFDLVWVVTDANHAARGDRLREIRPGDPLLFAAERRPAPFHDQLTEPLRELERLQGWEEGFLADAFVRVLATGDPTLQQALELRVEGLFDSRGIAHQWGPEDGLDAVKEHRFA